MFNKLIELFTFPVLRVADPADGGGTATAESEAAEDTGASIEQDALDALSAELDQEFSTESEDPDGARSVETAHDGEEEESDDEESEESESEDAEEESEDDESEEDESEESEEDEDQDDEAEGLPPAAYRQVKKFRKRAQAAEKELQTTKQQLEQLQARDSEVAAEVDKLRAEKTILAPTPDNPLADIQDPEQLQHAESFAQALVDWCDDNPQGGECPLLAKGDEPEQIESDRVKALKAQARNELRAIPKQRQWLQRNAEVDRVLKETLPELADDKSEISRRLNQIVANFPAIKSQPGYKMAALYYELGRQAIQHAGKDAIKAVQGLKKSDAPQKTAKKKPAKKSPVRPQTPPSFRSPKQVRRSKQSQRSEPATREQAASLIDVSDHDI